MTLAQVDVGASGGEILKGGGQWALACMALAIGLAATFLLRRAGRGSQSSDKPLD
jgi:hypothetical protein